jgi:hypothetical protein
MNIVGTFNVHVSVRAAVLSHSVKRLGNGFLISISKIILVIASLIGSPMSSLSLVSASSLGILSSFYFGKVQCTFSPRKNDVPNYL